MPNTRDLVLGAIRKALHGAPASSYDAIQRNYHQHGSLHSEERIALFEDRLRDYGCDVLRCAEGEIAATIAGLLAKRQKTSLYVPQGISRAWLPESLHVEIDGPQVPYRTLDACQGVLTGCALAIAETGTIVLRHTEAEGRRALTLVPDYHVCVVLESQLVESVVEGFDRMNDFSRLPITTISGPSATADIEMIRVQGVHGPRTLDVILVTP